MNAARIAIVTTISSVFTLPIVAAITLIVTAR